MRGLEREISKLCRKAVKQLLLDKSLKHIEINGDNLHDYLGVQRFDYGRADNENRVGQVIGLAWTEVGGDLLTIETACVPGKGKLTYLRFARRSDAGVYSGGVNGGSCACGKTGDQP